MNFPLEKIVCCAWSNLITIDGVTHEFFLLVPIQQLPMDFYNEYRNTYGINLHELHFITNHGRTLTPKTALQVAIDANQLRDDVRVFRGELSPLNIFNYER